MKRNGQKAPYLTYGAGYILSLILTLGAYYVAQSYLHAYPHAAHAHAWLLIGLTGLAVVQLAIQLLFFLHLGAESRPRWRLRVFVFMLVVVGIIVLGSLWIMQNLNYTMTQKQINTYVQSQDGL